MSKKALIVWGGWNGHTPKESAEVFAPLLKDKGYDVVVSDTLDSYLDAALMDSLSLVVPIWTMGKITGDQAKGLMNAVKAGVGLAGFHGGIIDSFRDNTSYQWMTGGQWVAHPGNCIPSYEVKITDKNHEITRGLGDFTLSNTEQYYMHVDPAVHVLAKTTFVEEKAIDENTKGLYPVGVVMPYAWTRQYKAGRVFVAAWGHTYKDFDVPVAREFVLRGMLWASR